MNRRTWIIALVVVGVAVAILIGVLGSRGEETQAQAQQNLCSSLASLSTATKDLTGLDPSTASKSDYEDAVSEVQGDWDDVADDAQDLASINTSMLDSAWDSFTQAVQAVPSDASASDALQSVAQAGQQLVATTQTTLNGLDCSS
jgi:hypothetical protein